jgi:putative membrane protein
MLWVKSFHVVAIVSWMAALLYLPRLMVYHVDCAPGSEQSETFKIMERRLQKAIATPAMIASWVLGLWLAYLIDAWDMVWFWAKMIFVLALTIFHMQAVGWVRVFADDRNERSGRYYRIANEVPTVLMFAIVIFVIVKPF